jgi:hypothetical protein
MKKYIVLLLAALLTTSCNSQESKNKEEPDKKEEVVAEAPKGSWKVNREYDEAGNLIRYDSIYSWSSGDDLDKLATFDRDSTLKSMQSRFYRNFSQFDFDKEGFGDLFTEDSLFMKRFFNNDFFGNEFGKDFMDIDKMHERMEAMQKQFLDRYKPLMEPQKEEDSLNQD